MLINICLGVGRIGEIAMDFKVIAISDYTTDDMPRRATLEVATDSSRKFNAFLFPHAENDKESNLVAAIGATDDFKYATSSNILLQEIKNAPLKEWCVDTNVEVYL